MARGKRSLEASLEALPPLFRRGRWWAADFRGWGRGRITLRDPDAPTWPVGGERTEDYEVAVRWALAYLRHFREEVRRRQLKLGPLPRRLGAAADTWLRVRFHQQARNTWQANRTALAQLRNFAGEDFSTARLTPPVLQELFDGLHAAGYAASTLHVYRQSISGFLCWLSGKPLRAPNAARDVRLPAVPREEVQTWTPEERNRLAAVADELDLERADFGAHRLLVELALASGARRSELFALRWERIDDKLRTIRITHQVAPHRRALVRLKGKTARTTLLLPSWWEHHETARAERGLRGEGATGFVLAGPDRELLAPYRFQEIRLRLLERAGLHRLGLGFHIDRHTYARDFVELGGRFEELQKSLGHKSIVTTEQLYGHFHEDVAAELARRRIYREEPLRLVR